MLLSPCGHQERSHYAPAYACILHYLTVVYAFLVPEGTGKLRTHLLGREAGRSREGQVLFTSFSNLGILYQCVPNVYLVYLTFKKQN